MRGGADGGALNARAGGKGNLGERSAPSRPAADFGTLFSLVERRKGRGGSKTEGPDITVWRGMGVELTITPRFVVANASFYTSSNARIHNAIREGGRGRRMGTYLDVVVAGNVSDASLARIAQLVEKRDGRRAITRRRSDRLERPA